MNDLQRRTRRATLTTVIATALVLAIVGRPQPARADWHSLSGLLPEYTQSLDYKISPDSRYVAYVADVDTDDVNEIYSVPIAGGTPVKLNPPLVAGGAVNAFSFLFTPDSQFVIYLADQEVDNRVEMYRVPVGGGTAVKLNGTLVVGGNVLGFQLDAKSQRVVYVADQQTNDVNELWSVPIAGGTSIKLNGPMTSGGDIGIDVLDPLSNRVIYSADQETDGKYELYSVPITGGAVTKLNQPISLIGGGDAGIYSEFAVDPGAPVVVYMAAEMGSGIKNLFMVPTAGGSTPLKLNFDLLTNQRLLGFRISPTGDRVVFNVGTNTLSQYTSKGNLYSTLIGGGGNANLTETADPLFGVDYYGFTFTPDGKRVVYQYQKNAASNKRLESSTMLGERVTLYEPSSSDPPLYTYRISADSQWVLYQTGNDPSTQELNTIPPIGGSAVRFGRAFIPGGSAFSTPDSSRVVFARVTGAENQTDLLSAQIFGGDERNLSRLEVTSYISDVQVSSDSKWIVYLVQINDAGDYRYDLRVSDGKVAQSPTTPTVMASTQPSALPSAQPTAPPAITPVAQPPQREVYLPLVLQ